MREVDFLVLVRCFESGYTGHGLALLKLKVLDYWILFVLSFGVRQGGFPWVHGCRYSPSPKTSGATGLLRQSSWGSVPLDPDLRYALTWYKVFKFMRDMATIPPLEFTSPNVIPEIANGVRSTFLTQKTKPLEFRLVQLRKLYWG